MTGTNMTEYYINEAEAYVFVIFSSVGLCLSLVFILLFILTPKVRSSPGDIYFGTSIAEGLLALHQY
jgi:hypothetical protein